MMQPARDEPPVHRQIYARQMLARAFVDHDPRLEQALSRVQREDFLGPPPWHIRDHDGYRALPSSDPVVLYQDVLVALDPARAVNNGSPSLHAALVHRLDVKEGEHVVHLGAGSGYYTAILAELVGPSGHVTAVEYDEVLATKAQRALAAYAWVDVRQGNALAWRGDNADAIYVNFALDHPPAGWVGALSARGRLILPFGVPALDEAGRPGKTTARAGMLLLERNANAIAARFLQAVSFVWAEATETMPGRHEGLMAAFRAGGHRKVRSLRRGPLQDEAEWYGEAEWGLSYREV
jgi:protein-L-isoaspartate(D-aspartate) O-methyltransferase